MDMNFDLNLYRTFYIVAKCNSFTKALQELYISQPAVTQAIKKLEEQLNVELFKRTSNAISLTKAGEVVFYYSEKLYELASANNKLIKDAKEVSFEVINIGVPTHIGTFYFVKYLKEFNKKHPKIRINIINKKSEEMIKMLIKRELDIVIDTNMIEYNEELLQINKVLDLESCFVCNKKYKYVADKGIISPNELIKYPLIIPGQSTSNRKMIDLFFKKKNIILNPLIESSSSSITKEIINEGLGIGWMIKEFVQDDLEQGNLFEVKVDIDQVLTPVSIAYNKKFNHELIKEFIKMMRKEK